MAIRGKSEDILGPSQGAGGGCSRRGEGTAGVREAARALSGAR